MAAIRDDFPAPTDPQTPTRLPCTDTQTHTPAARSSSDSIQSDRVLYLGYEDADVEQNGDLAHGDFVDSPFVAIRSAKSALAFQISVNWRVIGHRYDTRISVKWLIPFMFDRVVRYTGMLELIS